MKKFIKRLLDFCGVDVNACFRRFARISLLLAMRQNKLGGLVEKLRMLEPDISAQEESERIVFNKDSELKRRILQAFQCSMMLRCFDSYSSGRLSVVDIGDSAGTHMRYLKALVGNRCDLQTTSVNLDPRAIEKIKAKGQDAILCRAEDLDLHGKHVDMFTSFEMIEHLHNPAIFFYRLAKKNACNQLVITVPYLRKSRVGLYHSRIPSQEPVHAEEEHIFELSPDDWSLLMLHSGWRVRENRIYYQYPRKIPLVSSLFAYFWRRYDFEGFWGAILEKDTSVADSYKDWDS